MADRLRKSGWTPQTARAVASFHADWLWKLREADSQAYDRTLALLEQLPVDQVSDALRLRPELAGLFLSVVNPGTLARELSDPVDGDLIASLFQLHADTGDARRLAAALPGNLRIIADLMRRGMVGAEHLFIFNRDARTTDEYSLWLRDCLKDALSRDDEELTRTVLLLLEHGQGIRQLMAEKGVTRTEFSNRWAKLQRVALQYDCGVTAFLNLPEPWDFLAADDAESLLAKAGPMAVELLYGKSSGYRTEHRRRMITRLLLQGDEQVAGLLWCARSEPVILKFLDRNPALKESTWKALAEQVLGHQEGDHQEGDHQKRVRQRLRDLQKHVDDEDRLRTVLGQKKPGAAELLPFYSVYKLIGFFGVSSG